MFSFRCTSLWNKCNRPKSAELIRECLGCYLPTPVVTRWNSLFDSISQIVIRKQEINDLCAQLGILKFSNTDFDYLDDYCTLMSPIAAALDFLQGEENMYFGFLLSTLISVKVKIRRLHDNYNFSYLKDVCPQMLDSLIERFKFLFEATPESNDLIIAAIACPNIKLKFLKVLSETARHINKANLKAMFMKASVEFKDDEMQTMKVAENITTEKFFDYGYSDGLFFFNLKMIIDNFLCR